MRDGAGGGALTLRDPPRGRVDRAAVRASRWREDGPTRRRGDGARGVAALAAGILSEQNEASG